MVLAGCVVLSACVQSSGGLDDGEGLTASDLELSEDGQGDDAANQDGITKVAPTVTQKGTTIRAVVNGQPITSYDVQRRAAFLRLRRVGGDRNARALNELVEQLLKLQEAERLSLVASNSIIDRAFADFAKSNRLSPAQLSNALNQAGVTPRHFRGFLRTQISWQQVVGRRFQSETTQMSQTAALSTIRKSGEEKPETREYQLQQVIFVVPQARREQLLRQRQTEARAFRQRFSSCQETIEFAKQLTDVTVRDLNRVLEPELPQRWKEEITSTQVGETTPIKDTERGVEFIAVCSVRSVSDDRAAQLVTQSKEFESFNETGDKVASDYLKELRENATIVYR